MTNIDLLKAMGSIDPKLISDASPDVPQKKSAKVALLKWVGAAACLFLAVRIAIAFIPSQATDPFHVGNRYEIRSVSELPVEYDGKILVENLDLSEMATIDFYYKKSGSMTNTDDWYSLIVADYQGDRELLMHCMFGDTTVDDWKVRMVFTKKATKTVTINGVNVQIARLEPSLGYEYWHYAIFEYDDIVYDIRVQSNDSDYILDVLNQLLVE